MDYLEARTIQPGDTIVYLLAGNEVEAEVTGPIHDYQRRPADVIYVPVRGMMVNRIDIVRVIRAQPVPD